MTEKDKRVLKYAIDNLVLREIELCKGSCKSNLENKANRERDPHSRHQHPRPD